MYKYIIIKIQNSYDLKFELIKKYSLWKLAIKLNWIMTLFELKNLLLDEKLSSIKEKLKTKIGNSQILNKGNDPIELEDENYFTLTEIIKDNILLL